MQAAVFEFLFNIGDAEAVGDGRVDLHRFQGFITALLLRPGVAGAHIVQPVAQFDNHDTDVLTHRQQHLAQVFGLTILDVREFDLGQLGNAVDEQCDFGAEFLLDLGHRDGGVLGYIVHEGGGDALAVHAQLDENPRHRKRMADIRLAAAAALFAVGFFGQCIGAVDHIEVIRTSTVDETLLEVVVGNWHRYFPHSFVFHVFPVFHSPFPSPDSSILGSPG